MPTILVVDDEPLIVLALEAVLEDAGYTVVTAANGRQALDRLAEGPYPDLVLLDMMMPVIILSSLPEDAFRARATGFTAILRKPYTADQVLGTIAQVLGNTGLGTPRSN